MRMTYGPVCRYSQLHMQWGKWARSVVGPYERPLPQDRDRDRVLRIGYVSGDLCEHVVADCVEVSQQHARGMHAGFGA
jgi:predicted O-linked N-acetylglucosamine transferase (SPINDLY family)